MPEADSNPKHETVLDVTAEQLARTYAEAFLGAAGGGSEAAVEELTAVVDEAIRPNPSFAEALRSAFISHEDRVGMIDRVFGGRVSEVVLNFLKVMSAHNRLGIVAGVAKQAGRLLNERLGRVSVEVASAAALPADLLAEIEATLRSRLGIDPVLETEIDPGLIAGVSIRVGDTVYDGSLRNTLNKARAAMVEQTVARIESNPNQFFADTPSAE